MKLWINVCYHHVEERFENFKQLLENLKSLKTEKTKIIINTNTEIDCDLPINISLLQDPYHLTWEHKKYMQSFLDSDFTHFMYLEGNLLYNHFKDKNMNELTETDVHNYKNLVYNNITSKKYLNHINLLNKEAYMKLNVRNDNIPFGTSIRSVKVPSQLKVKYPSGIEFIDDAFVFLTHGLSQLIGLSL